MPSGAFNRTVLKEEPAYRITTDLRKSTHPPHPHVVPNKESGKQHPSRQQHVAKATDGGRVSRLDTPQAKAALDSPHRTNNAIQTQREAPSLPAAIVVRLREAFHKSHESIDSFWGIHTLMAEQCGVHVTPDTLVKLLFDVGILNNRDFGDKQGREGAAMDYAANGLLDSDGFGEQEGNSAHQHLTASDIEGIPILLTEDDFINLMGRIANSTDYDTVFLDKDDKLLDEALYGELCGTEAIQASVSMSQAAAPLSDSTQAMSDRVPPVSASQTTSNISAARLERFLHRFGISASMELVSDKYRDLVSEQRRKRDVAAGTIAALSNRRGTMRSSITSHTNFSLLVSDSKLRKGSTLSVGSGATADADPSGDDHLAKSVKLLLQGPGGDGSEGGDDITVDALRSTILTGVAPSSASMTLSPDAKKKVRIRDGTPGGATTSQDAAYARKGVAGGKSVLLPPIEGTTHLISSARHQEKSRWRFENFSTDAFSEQPSSNQGNMDNDEDTAFLLVNGYLPGESALTATPNLLFPSTTIHDEKSSALRRKFGSMRKKSIRKGASQRNNVTPRATSNNQSQPPPNSSLASAPTHLMLEHTFGASVAESDAESSDGVVPSEGGTAVTGQASTGHLGSDDISSGDEQADSVDSETAAVFFAAKQETYLAEKVIRKLRSRQRLKGGDSSRMEDSQMALSLPSRSMNQQPTLMALGEEGSTNPLQPQEVSPSNSSEGTTTARHNANDAALTSSYERRPKRQFSALTAYPSGGPTTESSVVKVASSTPTATPAVLHIGDQSLLPTVVGRQDPNSPVHSTALDPSLEQSPRENHLMGSPIRKGYISASLTRTGKLRKEYDKPWKLTKGEIQRDEKMRKTNLIVQRQKSRMGGNEDDCTADEEELLHEFVRTGGIKSRQAVVTSPPPKHWKRPPPSSPQVESGESPQKMREKWVTELKDFSSAELHELRPFVPLHVQGVIDGVLYARQEASINELMRGTHTNEGTGVNSVTTGLVVEDRPIAHPKLTPNPFRKKITSKLNSNGKNTNHNSIGGGSSTHEGGKLGLEGLPSPTKSAPTSSRSADVVGIDPQISRWISSSKSR